MSQPRSIWNGALSFAGIDVPVKVFGAADPQGVQFRELHEPDGAEIAHELVNADGGADFDHDAYKDRYRRRLRKLVKDKEAGETIEAPPSPKTPGPPPDIMEALKASLDKVRAGAGSR